MYIPKEIKVRIREYERGDYDRAASEYAKIKVDNPLGYVTYTIKC